MVTAYLLNNARYAAITVSSARRSATYRLRPPKLRFLSPIRAQDSFEIAPKQRKVPSGLAPLNLGLWRRHSPESHSVIKRQRSPERRGRSSRWGP